MVNFAQSYVSTVQSLTASNSLKELLEYCRRELENLEKTNAIDIDRIIANLPASTCSLGLLYALIAKNAMIAKSRSEDDLIKFLLQMQEITNTFNMEQIEFSCEVYLTFFKNVADMLLTKNRPLYGIVLLEMAISHLCRGKTNRITSLHASLFALCLRAKRFDRALTYFTFDLSDLFESAINGSSLIDVKSFISFFYYAGICYGALELYEEAILMFEHAICTPAMGVSAIVVEALKKYILLNCLLGKKVRLPGYRSATVQRNIVPLCEPYFKLINVYKNAIAKRPKEIASIVNNFIDQKKSPFEKDNNLGIIRQMLNKANECLMLRLPNAFISLNLSEVHKRAHAKDSQESEQLMRILIYRQMFSAKIDKRTKIVYFEVPEDTHDTLLIDAALRDLIDLSDLISNFDESIRLNPSYLSKSGKSGSGPFHEDEGFQMTSNTFQSTTNAPFAP